MKNSTLEKIITKARALYDKVCGATEQATGKIQAVYAERVDELDSIDQQLEQEKKLEQNNQS